MTRWRKNRKRGGNISATSPNRIGNAIGHKYSVIRYEDQSLTEMSKAILSIEEDDDTEMFHWPKFTAAPGSHNQNNMHLLEESL